MAEFEIRTTRVIEGVRITRAGFTERVMRVEYMVGEHGPFAVELPAAEFSPERVKAEQEKVAATLRQL